MSNIESKDKNLLGIAEVKILYAHVKNNLMANMRKLGYANLAPDFKSSVTVSLSPDQGAMYIPLFYNKETGNYIHLLVMKSAKLVKSTVILLEPDKVWYQGGKPLDQYYSMDGQISYYNSSGIFRQTFRVVKGLVAADVNVI
ncbi:MAG: hypothetical protein WDN26_11020 [Chitinophagaceae bacterium]